MFWIIISIVAVIGIGIAIHQLTGRWGPKMLLAIFGLLLILPGCLTTVPTGNTGIITTFGRVENYTLEAGLHWKSPMQSVVCMENKVQKNTVTLSCFSSDIQEVTAVYTVNYQIDKTNAQTIYREIGTNYAEVVITPRIREAVKAVFSQHNAENLITNRGDLSSMIEDLLCAELKTYNIDLVGASLEDIDFADAYTDAVEAKQVAEQNKLRAETEAEQKVIEAEAAAQVAVIEAQAEAEAMLTRATAEAEANSKIAQSLSQALINYKYLEEWDGKLPTVTSDGASVFDFGNIAG